MKNNFVRNAALAALVVTGAAGQMAVNAASPFELSEVPNLANGSALQVAEKCGAGSCGSGSKEEKGEHKCGSKDKDHHCGSKDSKGQHCGSKEEKGEHKCGAASCSAKDKPEDKKD